jgi:hypothetical protein
MHTIRNYRITFVIIILLSLLRGSNVVQYKNFHLFASVKFYTYRIASELIIMIIVTRALCRRHRIRKWRFMSAYVSCRWTRPEYDTLHDVCVHYYTSQYPVDVLRYVSYIIPFLNAHLFTLKTFERERLVMRCQKIARLK